MSKPSKAERKEDRVQQLERELSMEKKKSQELQQQKTIRLDEQQMEQFLDELTKRYDWQTKAIVGEIQDKKMAVNVYTGSRNRKDWFSVIVRIALSMLFIATGIMICYGLTKIWNSFWGKGWAEKASVIIMTLIAAVCVFIGIDIYREKDRNYIVSLFSALVALVALIVTLIK